MTDHPSALVRVPEPLWMMHVIGPDDLYPAPDHATAVQWCAYLNHEIAPKVPDVLCIGVPAIWTGTAEEHAEGLPEAIKGWTVPAAPAAPQAAGVGGAVARVVAALERDQFCAGTTLRHQDVRCLLSALRSPSRELEGGAARPLHSYAIKGQCNCSVCLRIRRDRDALATREEAPAEAGEKSLVDWFSQFIERHQEGCGSDTDALIACLDRVRDSYRAQPPAREDAQPVELVSKAQSFDAEVAWLHEAARYFSARDTKGEDRAHWANVYNAENANKLADRLAELSSSHCQLPPAPDALRRAVSDIDAERQRQVDAEGWSADRDDGYADAELAKSAAAYTLSACGFSPDAAREMWPRSWSAHWWKPTTARRDLVKAGALIVAEIERLDRQALAALQAEQGAK